MTCRSCGAEIADKAIVCYRCGTPTVELVARQAPHAARRRRPIALIVLAAAAALLLWQLLGRG